MQKPDNKNFTDSPQDQTSGTTKKSTKPPPKQKKNIEDQLKAEIKKLKKQIDLLTSQSVVYPDAFMNLDVFCLSLGVTQKEYKLLLESLRTDAEFYEVSDQTRRLYGRTGIQHLFKIRDEVAGQIKNASKQRKEYNK